MSEKHAKAMKKRWRDKEAKAKLCAAISEGAKASWATAERRLHMMASMVVHKPRIATDYTRLEWSALTYEQKRAYLADRI